MLQINTQTDHNKSVSEKKIAHEIRCRKFFEKFGHQKKKKNNNNIVNGYEVTKNMN